MSFCKSSTALQNCLLCVPLIVLSGCSDENATSATADSVRSVTLALNWYPEAEHGGFIAAGELGLFEQQGLAVEIVPGGPAAPNMVIQELVAGRIEFAVSSADQVITARAKGVPVVAVLAALQQSPRCIMVHESAGFSTLHDLRDVELAISEARPFALWMKKQLPLQNVTMVPYNGLVGEFLVKDNFAQQAYVFSEPFLAREKGSDPKVLMVSEIGFNPYTSLLVTTEQIIADDPELVQEMVTACQQGWQQYLRSPDATNKRLNTDNSDLSLEALQYAVDALRPLCEVADGEPFGGMSAERWQELILQIEQVDAIEPGSVVANGCFSNQFVANAPALSIAP